MVTSSSCSSEKGLKTLLEGCALNTYDAGCPIAEEVKVHILGFPGVEHGHHRSVQQEALHAYQRRQ